MLGLIQGLTEFLPISSSGHLVIGQTIFGLRGDHLPFDVVVHGATLGAIAIHFRHRLIELLSSVDLDYFGKLGLGTLPALIVGLTLRHPIERLFDAPLVVAGLLAVTGTMLLSLYWRRPGRRGSERSTTGWAEGSEEPTWAAAFLIGCVQAVAILPGISRSGSTIVAAIWLGVAPAAAAEFSFLLGIPAIGGAIVLLTGDVGTAARGGEGTELLLGAGTALISGLVAITLVFRLLAGHGFRRFGFYCWIVAALFGIYVITRGAA